MRHVKQSFEVLDKLPAEEIYRKIERIARVCYKSEDRIGPGTSFRMVENLVKNRHWAMLEHATVSVLWTVSRSVSHAMVRHRIGSMAQESTQYCDYASGRFGGDVVFVEYEPNDDEDARLVREAEGMSEHAYKNLRSLGVPPVLARDVLTHSLKTELVTTFNLSQWRHFFEMRADPADSPQMRSIVGECLEAFREWMPEVFLDVEPFSERVKRERETWSLLEILAELAPNLGDSDAAKTLKSLVATKVDGWLHSRETRRKI